MTSALDGMMHHHRLNQ